MAIVTVGLDVGGTKILAVALDEAGDVRATSRVPTPTEDPDALVAALSHAVDSVGEQVGADVAAVGVGMPGFISQAGVPQQAPNLPSSIGLDVPAALRARHDVPIVVDNDANCAAWAAAVRDAADADSLVAITFGTGIGGGIVIDRRIVRGANGFAGEPGHMIVQVGGWECPCGQRGCWEMYASGSGLGRLARAAVDDGRSSSLLAAAGGDVGAVDGPVVGRLAAEGDPAALEVLDEYARWVSVGLANLVNLLDPAVLVLGGGVVDLGDLVLGPVQAAMAAMPTMVRGRSTPVRLSSLGSTAGAVGAALLASESLTGGPKAPR